MLRIFAIFIFLLQGVVFGGNSLGFVEYKTKLLEAKNNQGKVLDSESIVVGSSGIVIHHFDKDKSSIIARAVVTKKENGFAFVKFEKFKPINQSAFPTPNIKAQKNDEIRLNYLYNRALIVAPNEKVYKKVTSYFTEIQWIHPDLMAAYLATDYKPNPSKYNFDEMCQQNTAGVIFFILDKKSYFTDCKSLKILRSYDSNPVTEYRLPFYNRIGDIDTVFWKISGEKIKDYNKFYSQLLGLK